MWYRFLFIVLLSSWTSYGQYRNNTYLYLSTQDGLASNNIRAIIQDHNRYIWIGTENGLQRYDGRRFVTYRKKFFVANSLLSDNIERLFEDNGGIIWIAALEGVCTLNPRTQQFEHIPITGTGDRSIDAKSFFQDSKGTIWLSTVNEGLLQFDKKKKVFDPALKDFEWFKWKPRQVVEERSGGCLWLGCDSGLAVYDMAGNAIYTKAHNPLGIPALKLNEFYENGINSFLTDGDDLWVFAWQYKKKRYGFYRFNSTTLKLCNYGPTQNESHTFWKDSKGTIWLYGNLFDYYNRQEDRLYEVLRSKERNAIDYGYVCQPLEDKEHRVWIGTDKGLYVSNAYNQKVYMKKFAAPKHDTDVDCHVLDFLKLTDGSLWAATWGYGIFIFDSQLRQVSNHNFMPRTHDGNFQMAWCLLQANDGRVWAGCQAGRLIIYDPKTKRYEFINPGAFSNKTIRSMAQDKDNNIWFGTQNKIIVKWDHNTNQFSQYNNLEYEKSDKYGVISRLLVDKNGSLWVATSNEGMLNIDTKTGLILAHYLPDKKDPQSISSTIVLCMTDNDSTLILGTSMGMNIFSKKTKKFRHITTADGLPSNTIYSVSTDSKGNSWLKMLDGIAKVSAGKNEVSVYGNKEGIVSEGAISTTTRIINDRMYIGSNSGFLYFHTDSMKKDDVPPDVQITGLRIFDKELNIDSIVRAGQSLRLKHSENFVGIQFSSPTFFNDNLTYYYKLEGIDNYWVKADGSLSTNYSNLPGGNYRFQIMCVNGDGIRSRNVTTLEIRIKPPVWKTWWFIFIAGFVAFSIVYGVHYARVRRILAMERVRERIALDLHDDMGSTLSTINILSEMAKMKVKTDSPKTAEYISKISDNSVRMMEAMDDIVWSINPMNDSMQKIVARMREYAASILEAKNIDYRFSVGDNINEVKLKMETRKDLFLIYKEALNNLAKYSNCRHASIDIGIVNHTLTMKIQDDGKGFDVNSADNGNGLTSMYKRAAAMVGTLKIESKMNVGTKLFLELKLT